MPRMHLKSKSCANDHNIAQLHPIVKGSDQAAWRDHWAEAPYLAAHRLSRPKWKGSNSPPRAAARFIGGARAFCVVSYKML